MKRLMSLLLWSVLAFSTTAQASGGGGGGESAGPYLAIEPPIVVNLQTNGRPRFMQVKIQLMTHNPKVREALTVHTAPVRDALIMLLSSQTAESMYDIQSREKVRQQALEAVQKVVEETTGIPPDGGKEGGLEALYFTDFVIQ